MWPVTQVNTDLKPPKIVKTEINSVGEKNPQCLLWLIKVFVINTAIQLLINIKYIILWFKDFLGFDFFRKVYISLIYIIWNKGKKTHSGWLLWRNFQIKEKQQTLMYMTVS